MKHSRTRQNGYSKIKAIAAISPERTIVLNVILGIAIVLLLILQALFINHVNTVSYKLSDLSVESSRLMERNGELEARIAELQTLGSIEERALELGMVPVGTYTFLSDTDTAVAKR